MLRGNAVSRTTRRPGAGCIPLPLSRLMLKFPERVAECTYAPRKDCELALAHVYVYVNRVEAAYTHSWSLAEHGGRRRHALICSVP